jgi:hypothetical protein
LPSDRIFIFVLSNNGASTEGMPTGVFIDLTAGKMTQETLGGNINGINGFSGLPAVTAMPLLG